MKRTRCVEREKTASAILCSDLHLSEARPISRIDDYLEAQERKLEFLRHLSQEHNNCPILCAGDVFDRWKISPWFAAWVYERIPRNMIVIPGNHDLPMRSMEEYPRSALHLLEVVLGEKGFRVLKEPPYELTIGGRKVLMLHELVVREDDLDNFQLRVLAGAKTSQEVLEEYGDRYDLILTGDNHQSFVDRLGRSILVNPGSMLRSTADQKDFRPSCYLYYARSQKVVPVYYPIEEDVFDCSHIERRREKDERIAAYIERLQGDWELSMSFRRNLEAFFAANNTPEEVREIIWAALEE